MLTTIAPSGGETTPVDPNNSYRRLAWTARGNKHHCLCLLLHLSRKALGFEPSARCNFVINVSSAVVKMSNVITLNFLQNPITSRIWICVVVPLNSSTCTLHIIATLQVKIPHRTCCPSIGSERPDFFPNVRRTFRTPNAFGSSESFGSSAISKRE